MATKEKEKKSVGRPRIDGWSIDAPACKSCGTDDRNDRNNRHHAQGYCFRCYHREWACSQPTLTSRTKIKNAEVSLEKAFKGELKALRSFYRSFTGNEGSKFVARHIGKVEQAVHDVNEAKRDLAILKKEAKNG
jgi:hypothetical protein